MKHSVSNLHVLFFPCVIHKANAHIGTQVLNMRHQAQKYFPGILFGILQLQKEYLVYVPGTRKIMSSSDVVFYKSSSGTLSYKVHSTIFLLVSRVSDFKGILQSQNLNRAQTKQYNITGVQYFFAYELGVVSLTSSSIIYYLFSFYLPQNFVRQ